VAGRTYEEQSVHDSLVRMMVNYYSTQGYSNIRADLESFARPEKFFWQGRQNETFIPDLTCQKNDAQKTQIILEAETCESIGLEHTRQQWQLFSATAIQYRKEFHVVVPRLCRVGGLIVSSEPLVQQSAREWGVTIHQIWWPSA
jgi:hypothetical protein